MFGRTRAFLAVGSVIALWHLHPMAQVPATEMIPGAEWLSWSTNEKQSYVSGFIDGYKSGTTQICAAADQYFSVKTPRGSSSEQVREGSSSAVCFANRGDYSRQYSTSAWLDFSAYVTAVTEFYSKHPEYRSIPFARLMLALRDGRSNSDAQLYRNALEGELR